MKLSSRAAISKSSCVLTALSFLVGCSGAVSRPAVHPVSGVVTGGTGSLDGVTIVFNPVDTKTNIGANGVLKADGSYQLAANDGRLGVEAGYYKVTLSVGKDAMMKAMQTMKAPRPGQPPKFDPPFPEAYLRLDATPKTVEVKAEMNKIDISL